MDTRLRELERAFHSDRTNEEAAAAYSAAKKRAGLDPPTIDGSEMQFGLEDVAEAYRFKFPPSAWREWFEQNLRIRVVPRHWPTERAIRTLQRIRWGVGPFRIHRGEHEDFWRPSKWARRDLWRLPPEKRMQVQKANRKLNPNNRFGEYP